MTGILSQKFFKNKNTTKISKNLLGKFLVRKYRGRIAAYMIIEVEAYDGFKDKASHAYRGKTERNKIMFGEAGHWYIYLIYGMHWILNIVTGPKDYPAAILIRSIVPKKFIQLSSDRLITGYKPNQYNGPAKITKALCIDKNFNWKPASKAEGLWIEDRGMKPGNPPSRKAPADDFNSLKRIKIKKGPRIGVDYAGPVWSKKKMRFYLK